MFETAVRIENGESVEENLRAKLARGDALAGTVQPILRHLLGSDHAAIFGDEILARVRGMAAHLAEQLLGGSSAGRGEALARTLLDDPAVLAHLHALAVEWQLTERLEESAAIDPVVPPLLQALLASPDAGTKEAGMKVLAAQARWCQAQRRMQLPIAELPGELLQIALLAARTVTPDGAPGEARIRAGYDEGASRLGLAARLVTSLGSAAVALLDLDHAGLGLFLTALAYGSKQPRDALSLCLHEGQATRLALSLRAAGLGAAATEQQLFRLHPNMAAPDGLARVSCEQAAALLGGDEH
ncbi:hypothetical protein HNO88_000383 [Novosphingobium chloroacetimidivorans]|uniref:DUF2336 domain-containing protein n=1 Tax=Novosphingobium chloroacetimidivorans TaxID=1428314 RepID=A0A7W7K730_9SPHN|nr:hypothetical protein [Novosphingobium chloroacetimidivorans]MBB4857086.1 hypothetical protein [Novosphingobium chloroacetimidivorans]